MQIDRYKNFKLFKLIQLILLILFGIMFYCYLSFDPLLKNNIYSNKNLLTICVFLLAFMLYSVVCLIADFSQLEKEIIEAHKLNQTAYLDSVTGMPNRICCDAMINKYSVYSDVSSFGVALFELPDLPLVNDKYGRLYGDKYLRDFTSILETVIGKYGFVGRNHGNDFLAIFENASEETVLQVISEINASIDTFNNKYGDPLLTMKYVYILNNKEGKQNFRELISSIYELKKRG